MTCIQLVLILAQAMYWLWLREDNRDEIVWEACVHPGGAS